MAQVPISRRRCTVRALAFRAGFEDFREKKPPADLGCWGTSTLLYEIGRQVAAFSSSIGPLPAIGRRGKLAPDLERLLTNRAWELRLRSSMAQPIEEAPE